MRKKEFLTKEQGLNYALRLLNQRSYSEAKLKEKLQFKPVTPEDTQTILAKLKEMKLIDDARYAASLVRTEAVYRHSSSRYITQKLRQKGVSKDIIESSLQTTNEEIPEEVERARHHAEKHQKKYADLPLFEKKQKLMSYLYRRGFSGAVIQRVIKELA
jgi:regulatory protein